MPASRILSPRCFDFPEQDRSHPNHHRVFASGVLACERGRASHILTIFPFDPARRFPSGLNATLMSALMWPPRAAAVRHRRAGAAPRRPSGHPTAHGPGCASHRSCAQGCWHKPRVTRLNPNHQPHVTWRRSPMCGFPPRELGLQF